MEGVFNRFVLAVYGSVSGIERLRAGPYGLSQGLDGDKTGGFYGPQCMCFPLPLLHPADDALPRLFRLDCVRRGYALIDKPPY